MVRSELIDVMSRQFSHLSAAQVEVMVNGILNVMVKTLMDNGRIEIRGFGTWCLRKRRSRNAHNPEQVKPSKRQRNMVSTSRLGNHCANVFMKEKKTQFLVCARVTVILQMTVMPNICICIC